MIGRTFLPIGSLPGGRAMIEKLKQEPQQGGGTHLAAALEEERTRRLGEDGGFQDRMQYEGDMGQVPTFEVPQRRLRPRFFGGGGFL